MRYGELRRRLHEQGWALHNLGSLPHISVAGAARPAPTARATATATWPPRSSALELVTADGELRTLSAAATPTSPARWSALGALGVVTRLTLDVEPTFDVRQDVYERPAAGAVADALRRDHGGGLQRQPVHRLAERRRRPGLAQGPGRSTGRRPPPASWLGATAGRRAAAPDRRVPTPATAPQQRGVPGPWHERLPHFRLDFTPSSGDELQSEYLVPREHAVAALAALDGARATASRRAAADLRAPHGRRRRPVAEPRARPRQRRLHFTWSQDAAARGRAPPATSSARSRRSGRGRTGARCPRSTPVRWRRATRGWPTRRRSGGGWTPGADSSNAYVDAVLGEV